jgi:lysophospholipase L1-like esterase
VSPGRGLRGLAVVAAVMVAMTGCGAHPTGAKHAARNDDPMPAGSVVGFYGDSLTSGVGASAPERRWATLLSTREGWTEVNPSVPGIGFLQARAGTDLPGQILAASPDLVIVTLGINDLWYVDSRGPELRAAIENDLRRLRSEAPDADLVVFALFSPLDVEPPQMTAINGWLRASAAEVDAVFLPKSAGWLPGHPDWTVDGIHFSDAGNAEIATLIDDELHRVL